MPTIAQYRPLSFTMHLFEIAFDKDDRLSYQDYPVFLHEYIHFIQDFAYCSSVMGFLSFIDDVLSFVKDTIITDRQVSIIKSDNYDKHRNLFLYFDSPDNGRLIDQIKAIAPLERGFSCKVVSTGILNNKQIDVHDIGIINIEEHYVDIQFSAFLGERRYFIGISDLQECQAYIAQRIAESILLDKGHPDVVKVPPLLPYFMVDYLFDFKQVKADDKCKFIILDIALDTLYPVSMLYALLEKYEDTGIDISVQYSEIVEFVFAIESSIGKTKHEFYLDILDKHKNLKANNLNSHLIMAIDAYLIVAKLLFDIREKKRDILCDLVINQAKFYQFIKRLCPIIVENPISEMGVFDGDNNDKFFNEYFFIAKGFFSTLRHFFSFISDTKNVIESSCPLIGACELLKENSGLLEVCTNTPWERNSDENSACIYSSVMKTLGLWEIEIFIE
ncbi:MAG: hypothetical protein Q8M98_08185 [Candidatus Cloacimonadaceae bacterium]|nr:hypothetical protein [Candidatus Cloacimonadaceae bacterium]